MNNRTSRLVGALLGVGIAGAASLAACSDDETTAPPGGTTSVGGNGGEAGSGGTGAGGTGGGEAGAGGEGGTPVLETIRVIDGFDDPVADVDVIVSDGAGELLQHTQTGQDGLVLVDVPSDGSVSTLIAESTVENGQVYLSRRIETGVGLEDGGAFQVRTGPYPDPPAQNDPMEVTVGLSAPCLFPPGATSDYRVFLSCGGGTNFGGSGSATVSDYRGCAGESTYNVYLLVLDADDAPVGFAYRSDQAFVPGGSAQHMLCPGNTDFIETSYTIQDIPAGSEYATTTLYGYRSAQSSQYDVRMYEPHWDPPSQVSHVLRMPNAMFAEYSYSVRVDLDASGASLLRGVIWNRRGVSALPQNVSYSVDEFAYVQDLPDLGVSNVARPSIAWGLASQGAVGDAVYLQTGWSPSADEGAVWRVRHPAVRNGEFQLPVLPEALADFRPEVGDAIGWVTAWHQDLVGVDGIAPFLEGEPEADDVFSASAQRSMN